MRRTTGQRRGLKFENSGLNRLSAKATTLSQSDVWEFDLRVHLMIGLSILVYEHSVQLPDISNGHAFAEMAQAR